jgi:arylsulfatase A-like enzyme/Tfp pilus assembly protein PilF
VAAVAIVSGAAWYASRPRVVRAPSGAVLGTLPAGEKPSDLSVLLVTLDTTRADHMGAYGYQGIETPAFDRIAREGVLFEHAESAAPLTLPAHSSIFTGLFPPEHGVRDNGGFFLAPSQVTLAERLKAAGLETGGFVGAYVLDHRWGINQGFDTYYDDFDLSKVKSMSLGSIQRPANEVADHVLDWLDHTDGRRFFAWAHFYDAHTPYDPPEPFKSRYPGHPYVGEIAFVDSQVGRLIGWLEDHHRLDRTIVVVMGDHGESLGDHGEAAHGFFVYQSTIHVPFAIRAPFALTRGRRVADVVRSVDVMPTVLDLLGLPVRGKVEGRSLVPLMTGATEDMGLEAYSEAVYPRYHFGWSDLRALHVGRYKYIEAPRPELYDLQDDPNEQHNLYPQRRELGDRMATALTALEGHMPAAAADAKPTPEVDPDARERLAALGYIGSFVPLAAHDRSGLADPKDKIGVFNLMNSARDSSKGEGDPDEGLKALLQVVKTDPEVIDAWFMLGNEYYRRGRFDDAIANYRKALALKPDYDLAVINMANAYRGLGRDDEALAGYRRYLQLDPNNAHVEYEAAQILIDTGRFQDASALLNAALKAEPTMAAARNALGIVAIREGDLARGEREIKAALAAKPDVRLAHYNLALLAERRHDLTTAIKEYQAEIALHADSYKAWFNLGKVYESVGDRVRQEEAFRKAIEANPDFAEGYLYLAKLYLESGQKLDEAVELAKKGNTLHPRPDIAPLGHYLLADLYSRLGRPADSAREARIGQALEKASR